jgi:hypothetical protein
VWRAAPLNDGLDAAADGVDAVDPALDPLDEDAAGVLGVFVAAVPPPPPPPLLPRSTAVPCDGAPSEGRCPASAGPALSASPAATSAILKLMSLKSPLLMAPPPGTELEHR